MVKHGIVRHIVNIICLLASVDCVATSMSLSSGMYRYAMADSPSSRVMHAALYHTALPRLWRIVMGCASAGILFMISAVRLSRYPSGALNGSFLIFCLIAVSLLSYDASDGHKV